MNNAHTLHVKFISFIYGNNIVIFIIDLTILINNKRIT